MRKTLIAAALAASFAAPAFADEGLFGVEGLTANVGVVSDYVFRGISQTRGTGALQAGLDYAHSSGFYVGTWASNVSWVRDARPEYYDNNLELDIYGGYKFEVANGVLLDVGAIKYMYPIRSGELPAGGNRTPNTDEVYVGVTAGIMTLKYNYVVSKDFIGWTPSAADKSSRGSNYLDLTLTYPVTDKVNLIAHAGRQVVKEYEPTASYSDWKLGATWDIGYGVLGLAATGSNANQNSGADAYGASNWNGYAIAGTRVAASFLKTF